MEGGPANAPAWARPPTSKARRGDGDVRGKGEAATADMVEREEGRKKGEEEEDDDEDDDDEKEVRKGGGGVGWPCL